MVSTTVKMITGSVSPTAMTLIAPRPAGGNTTEGFGEASCQVNCLPAGIPSYSRVM